MKKSIIVGAGTQGQIYASYLKEAGENIIGFIDDSDEIQGCLVNDIPVLGKYDAVGKFKLSELLMS